jgi:hypothetical protein
MNSQPMGQYFTSRGSWLSAEVMSKGSKFH